MRSRTGVEVALNRTVTRILPDSVITACVYTGAEREISARAVALVTSRQQDDAVWRELKARRDEWRSHGIHSVKVIGDAEAPAPIAEAGRRGEDPRRPRGARRVYRR
jgi:dimethylamine/trimethylamine dehydrogenase